MSGWSHSSGSWTKDLPEPTLPGLKAVVTFVSSTFPLNLFINCFEIKPVVNCAQRHDYRHDLSRNAGAFLLALPKQGTLYHHPFT